MQKTTKLQLFKGKLFLRGYTFVELFVVVILSSLLSLAVYTTFVSGLKMWQRIQNISLPQRKILLELEKFSQEIRHILNFTKIGLTGKINEITLPVLSDQEILKVSYLWEEKTFFRKQESFKDILEEKEQVKKKKLISGIEDLKFSFAYPEGEKKEYFWKDTWDKEDGLPVIIKMELKTKDASFLKAITIPVS